MAPEVLLEIIMRRRLVLSLVPFVCLHFAAADDDLSAPESLVSGSAIVHEINLARQNPAVYASYLEELRSRCDGKFLRQPGHVRICTKEGVHGLNEAIRFLRSIKPLPPLIVSPGMCKSAADHCADQTGGRLGHAGSDGSNPGRRMSRYGFWDSAWAENIWYGKTTPRDIVIQLIVDDGLSGRKHRKNIFNSTFNYAGAAYGPHAIYGSVCNIDFAANYIERDSAVIARGY